MASRGWVGATGALILAVACTACVQADRFSLGEQCEFNSECQDPLVCRFGKCRQACATWRDCGPGLICLVDGEGQGACSFPEETRCALDSDCPVGLVCRLAACTNACEDDRDCARGARCATDESGGRSCEYPDPSGCVRNSDCEDPLICRDGRCGFECFISGDCARGEICVDSRCELGDAGMSMPDGSADAGTDTGAPRCVNDAQCSDDVFCNGAERCRPASSEADDFGCVAPDGPPCASGTTCDEALDGCVSACDADGDGALAMGACGGNDCDDADPTISPLVADDCNYRDDDCDGAIDEAVDFARDVRHCGLCGNDCTVPNAVSACTAGACDLVRCFAGFVDRNLGFEDGCEAACTLGDDACNGVDDDCDGDVDEEPSASASCIVGPSVASASCVAGACLSTCDAGFEDCNRDAADGCEADLASAATCGDCASACSAGNACASGVCETSPIVAIEAGGSITCVRRASGRIACWGDGSEGALGNGDRAASAIPLTVPGLSGITALAMGGVTFSGSSSNYASHVCATDGAGVLRCWGDNSNNEAGPTTDVRFLVPTALPAPVVPTAIAAGRDHTCAVVGGGVRCWGDNTYGKLGDGTATSSATPVAAMGLTGAVSVSAGTLGTCAVRGDGTVACWGNNDHGRVGDGTRTRRETPVDVVGVTDAVEVACGNNHTCIRLGTGVVQCFGLNNDGQVGDGTTTVRHLVPVDVVGMTDAEEIGSGASFVCARRTGGTVQCWGENDYGTLGDGTGGDPTDESSVPVTVLGLSGVVDLAVGQRHACALRGDGSVRCWGHNGTGQSGAGTFESEYLVPVDVLGLP